MKSFLLSTISKYNFSLKKQLYSNKKLYTIDTAFADTISFKFSQDYGKKLENIVFLELKRDNNEIYYHKNNCECDFITVEKGKIKQAIQVTCSMENKETRKKREIDGLLDAMKCYDLDEGLILTQDEEDEEVVDGKKIIIKPVWKWLLE